MLKLKQHYHYLIQDYCSMRSAIKEYNPLIHNFNVQIVDCSYMFRVLRNNHSQAVYEKCKKIEIISLLCYWYAA